MKYVDRSTVEMNLRVSSCVEVIRADGHRVEVSIQRFGDPGGRRLPYTNWYLPILAGKRLKRVLAREKRRTVSIVDGCHAVDELSHSEIVDDRELAIARATDLALSIARI